MTPFFMITGIFVGLVIAAIFCEMKDRKTKKEKVSLIEQSKKNISEPVLSFVETVKENPKRFKLTSAAVGRYVDFKLVDRYTKESWYGVRRFSTEDDPRRNVGYPKWMNEDEIDYVYEELKVIFNHRSSTLKQLRNQRERKRLMKIYCKPQQENV